MTESTDRQPLEPTASRTPDPDPDLVRPADGPDDEGDREEGSVSEAGSSFSGSETTGGGADAAPGTPDGVPQGNRDGNEHAEEASEDDLRS